MHLRKHINNTDVAMEVIKRFSVTGKDWVDVKCRWWRVSTARNKPLYPMGIIEKHRIPLDKWRTEWLLFPDAPETIIEEV